MDQNWMELMQNQNQLAKVMDTNRFTEKYGLSLSEEDAKLILESERDCLKKEGRIELGEGIVPRIIKEFCDSDYIDRYNFTETIIRLQEIFYLYKNEMNDEITDDELLHLMREQYEQLCFGDTEYLAGNCLANFAQAVRMGYEGYIETDGYGQSDRFNLQERWSYELYLEALKELCWR